MATKMSKRELQSPDKFMTTTKKALDWATSHPRETAIGGGVVVAILVAIGLISGGDIKVDPAAGAALSNALGLAEREVVAPGDEPSAAADGEEASEETFPSETAKQEAIVAALVKVRSDYPGTSSALTAALSLGDAHYKLGNFDEALALYDEYLARAPKNGSLRFAALEGRAAVLQAKKDFDGALAAWEELGLQVPGYKARALLGKAILFEGEQRWDDARATYEALKKEFPDSPSARSGSQRLSALDFSHPPKDAPAAEDGAEEGAAVEIE